MEIKLDKKPEVATKEEKQRIVALLLSKAAWMAADYRVTIKHTGSLLSTSMVYAYSKGIQDAIKTILKEGENEKSNQTAEK